MKINFSINYGLFNFQIVLLKPSEHPFPHSVQNTIFVKTILHFLQYIFFHNFFSYIYISKIGIVRVKQVKKGDPSPLLSPSETHLEC